MAFNNKVSIDFTGDPQELNESLKKSESLITQYGKKIQNIMEKMGRAISYSLGLAARSITNSISQFKNLFFTLVDLSKTVGILNTQVSSLNSIFQNGIIAISEYASNLFSTWQIQKDLALTIQLTGKHAGYSSEQLERYSEYLEKTTKYSKEANMAAQGLLLHFRDIRGEQFIAATKAAQNMARALRIDLSQAAIEVGNALQNPLEAMNQLEQRNIFFTRKEQETILKLLEANKVIEAQTIVLKRLNESFGGYAQKAMSEFSDKIEQIRNRLYRVAQAIAEHVIRRINKLIGITADGTSSLEAYITKIESFVPVIADLIDVTIKKMQEWAIIIKEKLVVSFSYFTKIAIIGVSVIQTAFQNLTKIVRLVTANFELQLEKMKQTWMSIWTKVVPASLRYVERIFKEITEVKIPNFFTRMMQKILTIMTKGLVSGVLKLIDFASGRWMAALGIRGGLMGTNLMLKFIKAAIEAPLKMGGIYSKIFSTIFGLADIGIESIGASIGKKLAESEANAAKEKSELYKNNYGVDTIENFFKTLLPERADRNSLKAPDFKAMFDRNETELEKALKEEIDSLKSEIAKDFESNKEINIQKAEDLKKRVQALLAEQERANKEFKDKFGKNAPEPKLDAENKHVYDRMEAIRAKERLAEEEKRKKEKEAQEATSGLPDAISGLEEFWYKQNSPLEDNTKAVIENTSALSEAAKLENKKVEENKNIRKDKMGNAVPGFQAFIFTLPKNMEQAQRKLDLDRKKREREDQQFSRNAVTRARNERMLKNREAKQAIKEQKPFGINTEQQRKQAQMILNAQMRRGREHEENNRKFKEALAEARRNRSEELNKNKKSKVDIDRENKERQLAFDKYLRELIGETKTTGKHTERVADNLSNIGAF